MSTSLIEPSTTGDFWRALALQVRVLRALIIRELMMRYGRSNVGFFWLVLEPMILCAGVIVVRYLIQAHEDHGVSLVAILLTGYMPLTLWRHLTNKSVHLAFVNRGMFYHRGVTVVDVFLMTMALEFMGCTVAFVVNYGALIALNSLDPIVDYGLVCLGWATMGVLALGVSAMIAVLSERYEPAERFIQPLQYLILPVSGFLFMVDWLPTEVQKVAWYMPMIHSFEMVRAGFFGDSVITHYDTWYPLTVGLVLLAIYLPKIEKTRDYLIFS